jgi:hypothetical protein
MPDFSTMLLSKNQWIMLNFRRCSENRGAGEAFVFVKARSQILGMKAAKLTKSILNRLRARRQSDDQEIGQNTSPGRR